LLPREPARPASDRPSHGEIPDRYAAAALDKACDNIRYATAGRQEVTLNRECFAIGTLIAAIGEFEHEVRDNLRWAARQMISYREPWRERELIAKVDRAFNDGLQQPRGGRRYG
jgi:hypothetical protein